MCLWFGFRSVLWREKQKKKQRKHFNLFDEQTNATFSYVPQFDSLYLFLLLVRRRRRTEITRGIQIHNHRKIVKQLHVAVKSDHKTFTEKRFW